MAFGEASRRCAVRAIESVHQHMPGVPVCLCSDRALGPEDYLVVRPDKDIGGRQAKLQAHQWAPAEWEYIVYLDADVELVGSVRFLHQVLQDGWELVICKDMAKYDTVRMMLRPDNREEAEATWGELGTDQAFQYNGGLIGFRPYPRTRRFFEQWHREWQRWGKRDQGGLLRALHANPVGVFVLLNQWNCSTRYPAPPGQIAALHHSTEARRWHGIVRGRLDSPEAWQAVQTWERSGRKRVRL